MSRSLYGADTLRVQLAKVPIPTLDMPPRQEDMAERPERQAMPTYLERARASLAEAGLSVTQWAKENGFSVATTKAVIYGNSKALRGESHRVAIALGIKTGVVLANAKGFAPVRRIKAPLKAVKGSK